MMNDITPTRNDRLTPVLRLIGWSLVAGSLVQSYGSG